MLIYSEEGEIINLTSILEIAEAEFLQNVQDFFANTMNIASLIVDEKGHVTEPSNFCNFCENIIRSSEIGSKKCHECDLKWGKIAAEKGEPMIYTCHAGLIDFAIPIIIQGKHIASIYGGQILTEELNEEFLRKSANEMGLDEKEYIEEARKIPIVSNEKIQASVEFLHLVVKSISEICLANLKLAELGICYKPSKQIKMEEWFFSNIPKLRGTITEREFEVLKLIVMGKSNTEIAKELFISVHTAKAHVSSILEKLLVEDRVQLAVKAIREGLI